MALKRSSREKRIVVGQLKARDLFGLWGAMERVCIVSRGIAFLCIFEYSYF
jgi:hypothetical protein